MGIGIWAYRPSGWNLDFLYKRRRFRDGLAKLAHALEVSFDRLFHQAPSFFERRGGADAARQIGYVGAVTGRGRSVEHCVFHFFNPACFSIDALVPGSRSEDG